MHQIELLMASLQLRTYYFFVTSNPSTRRHGLLKAYTTALSLITHCTTPSPPPSTSSEFTNYAPNGHSQFLVMAAMLLLKILFSSYSHFIHFPTGRAAFDAVVLLLRRSSISAQDIRGRMSRILAQLWSFHQALPKARMDDEPKLNLRTRLGASLLHDLLWTWREEFGGQRAAAVAPPSSSSAPTAPPAPPAIISNPNSNNNTNTTTHNTIITPHPPAAPNPTNPTNPTNPAPPSSSSSSYEPAPPPSPTNFNLDTLDLEMQDANWLWDVGFPSVFSVDINSSLWEREGEGEGG